MLLDSLMPSWDVADRHDVIVRAPAETAYAAARGVDFASAPAVRLVLALRGLGAPRSLTLADAASWGFALLGEDPGREFVVGTVGRFWRFRQGRVAFDASTFRAHALAGTAKAAMAFWVEPIDPGRSRVVTETRVLSADRASKARFRLYWSLIWPGSALIRRAVLARIKADAERAS